MRISNFLLDEILYKRNNVSGKSLVLVIPESMREESYVAITIKVNRKSIPASSQDINDGWT